MRPLIHGATYFRALYDAVEATGPGDLVLFTDWQGDGDERLTDEPGSEVVEVLARADERGVVVCGLVWRSHLDQTGFFASQNRHLGEQLREAGRRGRARHAGACRGIAPPEVRRRAAP